MSDYAKWERRYREDAEFRVLVKSLIHMIESLHLTPQEIREAAMFAAIVFEQTHPKPIILGER